MFSIPSLRPLSFPAPSTELTLKSGVQAVKGATGLTSIFSGNMDDNFVNVSLSPPFSFKFYGSEFGNLTSNGIFVGSNGHLTFGSGSSSSVPSVLSIRFAAADRLLYQAAAGVDGAGYRVYWRGSTYGSTGDEIIVEIIFYPNNRFQLNYGTFTSGITGSTNLRNLSTTTISWSPPLNQSSSFAFQGDVDGNNYTVQAGYWG